MAEELENPVEESAAPVAAAEAVAEVPEVAAVHAALPVQPEPGMLWSALNLGALSMVVLGAMSYGTAHQLPGLLALGLAAWGVLDVAGHGPLLLRWAGKEAFFGNLLNLLRGVALLGLGLYLAGLPLAHKLGLELGAALNISQISRLGGAVAVIYVALAFLLELLFRRRGILGQSLLLASLAFQFIAYIYFSLPFTFTWAAVFSLIGFICASAGVSMGALAPRPSLGKGVLTLSLLIAAPFVTFLGQQMFFTEVQPVYQPTFMVPRARVVADNLAPGARDTRWAPRHTASAQPGDSPFSDKIAWVQPNKEQTGIGMVLQREEAHNPELWVPTGGDPKIEGWSADGSLLAYSDSPKQDGRRRMGVISDRQSRAGQILGRTKQDPEALLARVRPSDASMPDAGQHGQIWLDDSHYLYLASPAGDARHGSSTIHRSDLHKTSLAQISKQSPQTLPAVAPDGSRVAYLGFHQPPSWIQIADAGGANLRRFALERDGRYFPAWNSSQTRVLYVKDGRLMSMRANGTRTRIFNDSDLQDREWRTQDKALFTLEKKQKKGLWRIRTMETDGTDDRIVLEIDADRVYPPRWSPDSKRIAFTVKQGEEHALYTLDKDGSWPRRFFVTSDKILSMIWSPDSLRLAFIVQRHGEDGGHSDSGQELWTVRSDALDPKRVYEAKGQMDGLNFSPSSQYLSFEEKRAWHFLGLRLVQPDLYDVMTVDLVQEKTRPLTRYGLQARQPAFSPQGVALAYFMDQRPWYPGLFGQRRLSLVVSQLY